MVKMYSYGDTVLDYAWVNLMICGLESIMVKDPSPEQWYYDFNPSITSYTISEGVVNDFFSI
jgi:hypothetical protein